MPMGRRRHGLEGVADPEELIAERLLTWWLRQSPTTTGLARAPAWRVNARRRPFSRAREVARTGAERKRTEQYCRRPFKALTGGRRGPWGTL